MLVSTPYALVPSLITAAHVSIRTVRPNSGDVSRNGLVRFTYVGVRSIRPNV